VIYAAISVIGSVMWLPFIPAMLALVYRDRTAGEGPAGDAGPPDVEATPGVDGAASLIDAG
jgi:hypothetical protein